MNNTAYADALRKCTGSVEVTVTEERVVNGQVVVESTATARVNPETGTIFSRAELEAAFNRVSPKDNWKSRIDALITVGPNADDEMHVIGEAVIFYTGSVPTFTKVSEHVCRVKAAGYYATIGA